MRKRDAESLARWRRQYFLSLLDMNMIGCYVPPSYGPRSGHLFDVPDPNSPNLVVINSDECDIEPLPESKVPSLDELKRSYYVQSLKSIAVTDLDAPPASSDSEAEEAEEEEELEPRLDPLPELIRNGMPGELQVGVPAAFGTRAEFDAHRRDMATEYARLSAELGLPDTIRVCAIETCVNNAIPGSWFCLAHCGLDPKFDRQKLMKRCRYVHDDQRCSLPCLANERYCRGHLALVNH